MARHVDGSRDEASMLEADLVRAAMFPVMLGGTVLIWRSRRHVAGRLLVLIGALHLLGGWVGREPLRRIVAKGIVNQADSAVGNLPQVADQELVLWFLVWGVLTISIGQLVIAFERRGQAPPRWWGLELMVVNLACAALMPKGGFWWVLLPAWLIIRGRAPGSSAPGPA
jgi:hypothetical protein